MEKSSDRPITKAKLEALEKVFASEIEGALRGWGQIYQSKRKIYKELEAEGLVEWTEEVLGGKWPVTIAGWQLTMLGKWFIARTVQTMK